MASTAPTTTRVIAKRFASWNVSITRCVSAENGRFVLNHRVGRQAALRLTDRHRAARGVKAYADLARDLDLIIDTAAVGPQIRMIHRGRAAESSSSAQATAVALRSDSGVSRAQIG